MIQKLSNLVLQATHPKLRTKVTNQIFGEIVGYERIKRTLIDEIEYLKSEYRTVWLSLMERGIYTQKIGQTELKTWVFTSNGVKKLSVPLLSWFRVFNVHQYDFEQFYEISMKKTQTEGLALLATDRFARSVWESPRPNVRSCLQDSCRISKVLFQNAKNRI